MTSLDQISPIDVGERLRVARESAGLNQTKVADTIGVARTTLVAIEQGQRRIKLAEIQQLAKLYETSVNALLRQEAIQVNFAPRFRKLASSDGAEDEAAQLMTDLVKAEVELENLLGYKRAVYYPPERPLLPGDIKAQAEQNALELRQRLGLGLGPILDIVTLLELEMGIRVYVRRFDGRVSGLYAFDEAVGPCILLNANHPKERRSLTAGHECGHFISIRREPEVLYCGGVQTSREERYADAFGRSFLMPARAVMQKFHEVNAGSQKLSRRQVIILAHFFSVSREALVYRLEDLSLVKTGTWEWFLSNGGITDEQAIQVLGDLKIPDSDKAAADRPTTLRINLLASEVYRKGLLSEGQLARLLKLDRIELRETLCDQEFEGSEANEIFDLRN